MKIIIIVLIAWSIATLQSLSAQDLILQKDGTETYGKILEVTPAEVYFRLQKDTTQQVSTIPLSEVFMIKYENGHKDVFYKQPASTEAVPDKKDWNKSEKIYVVDNAFFYKELKRRDNFILHLLEREGLHEDVYKYTQGWQIQRKGSPFVTLGSLLMGLGVIFTPVGIVDGFEPGFVIAGASMLSLGTSLGLRGINLKKKGKQIKREAVEGYNTLFEY
jgi:hypothetical protein